MDTILKKKKYQEIPREIEWFQLFQVSHTQVTVHIAWPKNNRILKKKKK